MLLLMGITLRRAQNASPKNGSDKMGFAHQHDQNTARRRGSLASACFESRFCEGNCRPLGNTESYS
jgi:hypothetical protein